MYVCELPSDVFKEGQPCVTCETEALVEEFGKEPMVEGEEVS